MGARMRGFEGVDYYTVLGIRLDASSEEIRDRFRHLSRVRHPDKFATLSDEIRDAADDEFKRINIAYQVLHDPIRRAEYDRARGIGVRQRSESSTPHPIFSPANLDFGQLRHGE